MAEFLIRVMCLGVFISLAEGQIAFRNGSGIRVNTYIPNDKSIYGVYSNGDIRRIKVPNNMHEKQPTSVNNGFVYFDNFSPKLFTLTYHDANCYKNGVQKYVNSKLTILEGCTERICEGLKKGGPLQYQIETGSCSQVVISVFHGIRCAAGSRVTPTHGSIICSSLTCYEGTFDVGVETDFLGSSGDGLDYISVGGGANVDVSLQDLATAHNLPNLVDAWDILCPGLTTRTTDPHLVGVSINSFLSITTAFPSDDLRYQGATENNSTRKKRFIDIAAQAWLAALEARFNIALGDIQANRDQGNYNGGQIIDIWESLSEERTRNRILADNIEIEKDVVYRQYRMLRQSLVETQDIDKNLLLIIDSLRRVNTISQGEKDQAEMQAKADCENATGVSCRLLSKELYTSGAMSFMWSYGDPCTTTVNMQYGLRDDSCRFVGEYVMHNGEEGKVARDPIIDRLSCGFFFKKSEQTSGVFAQQRKSRSELVNLCEQMGCAYGNGIVPCGVTALENQALSNIQTLEDMGYTFTYRDALVCVNCTQESSNSTNSTSVDIYGNCGRCMEEEELAERAANVKLWDPNINAKSAAFWVDIINGAGDFINGVTSLPGKAISGLVGSLGVSLINSLAIASLAVGGVSIALNIIIMIIICKLARRQE